MTELSTRTPSKSQSKDPISVVHIVSKSVTYSQRIIVPWADTKTTRNMPHNIVHSHYISMTNIPF